MKSTKVLFGLLVNIISALVNKTFSHMKESYLPHAIPRTALVGKWFSLEEDPTMICIFVQTYSINLSLLAAMGKGKYPDLSKAGDSSSELALRRQHRWLGFIRSDKQWSFGLCVSHSCLRGCVTPPCGYFYTLGVRLKQYNYKLAEVPL